MTLRDELIKLNLRVPNPPVLGDMEIKGIVNYCPIGLKEYFCSLEFANCLEDLLFDLQDGFDHGYEASDFFLSLERTPEHKYWLKLNLVGLDDCIESYGQ